MAALDWIALAVVAVSFILGAWRGLVSQVLSLAGWLLAFWASYVWATDLAGALPMGGASAAWRLAVAFVLIFIGVVMLVSLVAALLRRLLNLIGLGPVDRALGALFGVARGVLLLMVFAVALRLVGLDAEAWWQESRSSVWLARGLDVVQPWLPQAFQPLLRHEGPPPGLLPRDGMQEGQPALRLPA
ncbi:MAG: CvpA family protein [Comamonas sp.]